MREFGPQPPPFSRTFRPRLDAVVVLDGCRGPLAAFWGPCSGRAGLAGRAGRPNMARAGRPGSLAWSLVVLVGLVGSLVLDAVLRCSMLVLCRLKQEGPMLLMRAAWC